MSTSSVHRIPTFEKFWPFYVGEHSKATTRWLHFAGTFGGTVAIVVLLATAHALYIPLTFIYGYGLAWMSRFFIEKNRPAPFKCPLWSLLADYRSN